MANMNETLQSNPYAAPTAIVAEAASEGEELAERITRFWAISIDGTVFLLVALVAVFIFAIGQSGGNKDGAIIVAGAVAGIGVLAMLAVNLRLLHRYGQTIGKRYMKIKIVRGNGERAGVSRIFVLRWLVPALLGGIPFVGSVFSLVDALFIFRDDRRCIHDRIADTIVIKDQLTRR